MSADGTWNVTLNTPMGAQAGTLELATDGNVLTGTMSGPQGSMELENGTADGDNLSWTVNMTQPMPITIEATAAIDGDEISGEVARFCREPARAQESQQNQYLERRVESSPGHLEDLCQDYPEKTGK